MAMTINQRAAKLRANRRKAGLLRVELWVHRSNVRRLREFAHRLNAAKAARGKHEH